MISISDSRVEASQILQRAQANREGTSDQAPKRASARAQAIKRSV